MNCKQGDLAVIVQAKLDARHLGKLVRCVRIASEWPKSDPPAWVIDPPLDSRFTQVYDYVLRPIRPQRNDATDEMIQLLGKPEGVRA